MRVCKYAYVYACVVFIAWRTGTAAHRFEGKDPRDFAVLTKVCFCALCLCMRVSKCAYVDACVVLIAWSMGTAAHQFGGNA